MPEVSQDVFESKNPVAMQTKLTSGVLRARANSANSKNVTFSECPDSVFPVLSKNFATSENDLESFTVGMPSVEYSWIDARELSHRYYIYNNFFICKSVLYFII